MPAASPVRVALCTLWLLAVPPSATAQPAPAADAAAIAAILRDQYDALLALDAARYAARYASHLADSAVWENALGDRYADDRDTPSATTHHHRQPPPATALHPAAAARPALAPTPPPTSAPPPAPTPPASATRPRPPA
jgi:hypothetical protein